MLFASCSSSDSTPTFCDTACKTDTIRFSGDNQFEQALKIGLKNCKPDTLIYYYKGARTEKRIHLGDYMGKPFTLNPNFVNCYFQDTTLAWLSFNDCVTGRGFLLKLDKNNKNTQKITSALNSFDKKFSIDQDLRAYTDAGNIFVENVTNGKKAEMTFKKEYQIDYNTIHKVIDSVHITKDRIFVQLISDGKPLPLEKKIEL